MLLCDIMIIMKNKASSLTPPSLFSFDVASTCFRVIFNPISFISLISYLWQVVITYGFRQFARKFGITKTPIIHVDHLLDCKIPFNKDKIKIYMDFVPFWIRPLTMLYKRIGYWQTTRVAANFMSLLKKIYKSADGFYKISLSTTVQPDTHGIKGFGAIHLLDPHYLCVPSLHIAIITMCRAFYNKLFSSKEFSQEEKDKWNEEIYTETVQIAESVLYVKQHSVNCIAAALYMMTKQMSEYVSIIDCVNFIADLFKNACDISPKISQEIRDHILLTYETFLLEGAFFTDWKAPVVKWIQNYKPATQSPAIN